MTKRLFDAVSSIRYRQIDILLQCGVDLNSKYQNGQTVLMAACDIADSKKRYKMFRHLVQKGSDEFESNDEGVSVFQYACSTGRIKIVRRMIKERGLHVVHLSWKDNRGRLALCHAVMSGKIELVRRLLIPMRTQGISVDQIDTDGNNPLILAYKLKYPKIAELLMDEGKANPRICDRELHLSAVEWAEVCESELREEKKMLTVKNREQNMIFPRINHKVFRRKQARKSQRDNNSNSLPMVVGEATCSSTSTYVGNIRVYPHELGASWSGTHSESAVFSHVTRGNSVQYIHGKSINSAMELLELASRAGGKRQYATTFVGSELDTNKSMDDGGMITTMMNTYSAQNSQSFRKTVKPQPKPVQPRVVTREKKRVSTLAIIMSRGSRASMTSRSRRGSRPASRVSSKASRRQSRPSSRKKKTSHADHSSTPVRLPKVDGASQTSAVGDVTKGRSLELIPEEGSGKKEHSRKVLRNEQFPTIGLRLVTQGVR